MAKKQTKSTQKVKAPVVVEPVKPVPVVAADPKGKTGPKGAYAVRKLVARLSEEDKRDLKRMYYLERASKCKVAQKANISHQLIPNLFSELGPLTDGDL